MNRWEIEAMRSKTNPVYASTVREDTEKLLIERRESTIGKPAEIRRAGDHSTGPKGNDGDCYALSA